jgi:hypothetical protein
LVCKHSVALIESPGLTGRATCAPVWIRTRVVTFWAVSTVISTWRSRNPRPKKVRKLFGRLPLGLWFRFGTVQVPDSTVIGPALLNSSNPQDSSGNSPKAAATGFVGLSAGRSLGLRWL